MPITDSTMIGHGEPGGASRGSEFAEVPPAQVSHIQEHRGTGGGMAAGLEEPSENAVQPHCLPLAGWSLSRGRESRGARSLRQFTAFASAAPPPDRLFAQLRERKITVRRDRSPVPPPEARTLEVRFTCAMSVVLDPIIAGSCESDEPPVSWRDSARAEHLARSGFVLAASSSRRSVDGIAVGRRLRERKECCLRLGPGGGDFGSEPLGYPSKSGAR